MLEDIEKVVLMQSGRTIGTMVVRGLNTQTQGFRVRTPMSTLVGILEQDGNQPDLLLNGM